MNRYEKRDKYYALRNLIKEKESLIKNEETLLTRLKEEAKTYIPEVPILLFLIDETAPMPDLDSDYLYEYIYYTPDMDTITYTRSHYKDRFLPNYIDMRKFFNEIPVPERENSVCSYKYSNEINYAVTKLKEIIDELFETKNINTWQELSLLIKNIPNYYEKPKYNENNIKK